MGGKRKGERGRAVWEVGGGVAVGKVVWAWEVGGGGVGGRCRRGYRLDGRIIGK